MVVLPQMSDTISAPEQGPCTSAGRSGSGLQNECRRTSAGLGGRYGEDFTVPVGTADASDHGLFAIAIVQPRAGLKTCHIREALDSLSVQFGDGAERQMLATNDKPIKRPGWTESAPWMGCSLPALWRILQAGQWRVDAAYWPECFVDLLFATFNSSLGFVQTVLYRSALARVRLPDDPVFIIGHWRTGTTLLHELLSLDPQMRSATNYECLVPNHFLLTGRWLTGWTQFTLPGTRPSDAMQVTWDSPQEDEFALCNMGVPSPYAAIAFPNEGGLNDAYLELDELPAEAQCRWEAALVLFFKRLLIARFSRLVLKSPTHTFRVPTLLRLFPRAKFVNIVRNPFAVFSSTVQLWRSLYETYGYQKPPSAGLEQHVLETFSRMHERLEHTRALVPTGSLIDVRYEDLIRDPLSAVSHIYQALQLGDFDVARPAVERYFAERKGYVASQHAVASPWSDEIRKRWRPYFERYGYSLDDGSCIEPVAANEL
jgi:omega-hydroxy-beta-dihydromenaquinone-9 sulfotransferase